MKTTIKMTIEKLVERPGQGSILEQLDKLVRKQQRTELYKMLEKIDKKEVEKYPVLLDKCVPQIEKKIPTMLRFSLQKWQRHDEVFWRSLGDYIILALHRVTDVEYDSTRGKIKVQYFAKTKGRVKSPEDIREIIQGIAFLVDMEVLPTDFTHFRRMAERLGSLGEMSKEQAAIIGAILKFI
jgi:hypothetical protein